MKELESLYKIYKENKLPFDEILKGSYIIDCIFADSKKEDVEILINIVLETKGISISQLQFDDDTYISKFFRYCLDNKILVPNPGYDEMSGYIADNDYQLSVKYQRELKLRKILD